MQKILTVIIPVYNAEPYLKRCFDSLNHPELNVVVIVDGACTDLSAEIVDDYCQTHPNFKAIHTHHRGAMAARQEGLKYIDTPYFSFVDSDDTVNIKNYVELCHAMKDQGYDVGNGRTTVYLPDCPIPFNSRKWSKSNIDFVNYHAINCMACFRC